MIVEEFMPGVWSDGVTNYSTPEEAISKIQRRARFKNEEVEVKLGLSLEQQEREKRLGINSSAPRMKIRSKL